MLKPNSFSRLDKVNFLAKTMKILIDKNIPYIEHFFADHIDQIEYFSMKILRLRASKKDSVVVVRSTYKTHGKKIPKSIKFLCSASTGEDHIDKRIEQDENSLCIFYWS